MRPPNSSVLASNDYHLLLFTANNLAGKELASKEAFKNRLFKTFVNRIKVFYHSGITASPSKWLKDIEQKGA